jgi:hypothetical protein
MYRRGPHEPKTALLALPVQPRRIECKRIGCEAIASILPNENPLVVSSPEAK